MKKQITIAFLLSFCSAIAAHAPKLTVVIVVDQFSAYLLNKLKPHYTGAFKFLQEHGLHYTNAFYDHAMPGTGPGHTLLTTGTFGSFHGIINNSWFDKDGNSITCDDDPKAPVFNPDGSLQSMGKSARNTLADNLSDQLVMYSYPQATNKVWALSLKSRAATAMAGHLGKAVWFDKKTGVFTSSKAYFEALPEWVTAFNKTHDVPAMGTVTWQPVFESTSPAYQYSNVHNYCYSSTPESIIGKPLPVKTTTYLQWFIKTPTATEYLLDLGIETLKQNFSNKNTERFVLWISLSGLDYIAHVFGPESKEALDMLYHMDRQLDKFINTIYTMTDPKDILLVLTGDHGASPIPELVRDRGYPNARRYHYPHIIENMNQLIEKKYCIKDIIQNFKEPQFYLNQTLLASLTEETKKAIYEDIKNYLLDLPGIRRAWTFEELQNEFFQDYNLDKYLQRQLYKERSGQILYAVNPYTHLDTYYPNGTYGTAHITQFAYDTQVPLIFYQQGRFEKKRITRNIYMPQFSVSLATLLEVPRPSAAAATVLPELFGEQP